MLCSHLGIVSPGVGMKPRIEGGVIKSDGRTIMAADDKFGIAAIMETLKTIITFNKPRHIDEIFL